MFYINFDSAVKNLRLDFTSKVFEYEFFQEPLYKTADDLRCVLFVSSHTHDVYNMVTSKYRFITVDVIAPIKFRGGSFRTQ